MSFGASNKPGTCLWCGRKIRRRDITYAHGGYPHGPYFDTGRCAEHFGRSFAQLGHRLKPATPADKDKTP